jgi:hypothetical protein
MGIFEKKGWYRLTIPEGWEADEAEDPVAIARADGSGALQVTAQAPRSLKSGGRIDALLMLRAFLKGIGVDIGKTRATRFERGGLEWAVSEYVGEDSQGGQAFWRVWMAANRDVLVFLTYACPEEDRDAEREAVDRIVASLELCSAGPGVP